MTAAGSNDDAPAARLAQLADYTGPIALGVIARLGVADHLIETNRSATELAKTLAVDAGALGRTLDALAALGVFDTPVPGRYALNATSELLRSDHPCSLRWVCSVMAADVQAWASIDHALRTGGASFLAVHGCDLWQYLEAHPDESLRFDLTMAALTRLELLSVLDAYDWKQFDTIVDVGGGNGSLLVGLLSRFPGLRGILFDVPQVALGARRIVEEAGLGARCEVIAGDFFQFVPASADAYVLKRIVYSWDDEAATRILKSISSTMAPHGRVLLLEPVRRRGTGNDYGKILDLQMMVLGGGAVRDRYELAGLLDAAGLELKRVIPTPTIAIVEARRRPT